MSESFLDNNYVSIHNIIINSVINAGEIYEHNTNIIEGVHTQKIMFFFKSKSKWKKKKRTNIKRIKIYSV